MMTQLHLVAPEIDDDADLAWHRQQRALASLSIGDILSEVDTLVVAEPDEQRHPLYSLVAHLRDARVQPGSAESLMATFRHLIAQATSRLMDRRLDALDGGEVRHGL